MARKRSTSKQAPAPTAPETAVGPGQTTRPAPGAQALRSETKSRFTLYNLLGKERAWYRVDRFNLNRPAEPVSEKSVAHSIMMIDRSGSMTPYIEDLKDTLIKLLTLEEYRNFDLLCTLISYSGQSDLQVHFQRAAIQEIMKRNSRQVEEIKKIRTTGLTCMSQALELAVSLVKPNEMTAITLHSDGYANDPSAAAEAKSLERLCNQMQDQPAFLNTIAYSDYSDFRLLSKIANLASGTCVKAGSIKEIYDALYSTSKLLGGAITPPIEEPLSPEYDYQVFVSHSAGKVNGAHGPLHIRGIKPEDDGFVYKFRKLSRAEYDAQKDAPVVQTGEPVLAFARANLAEGNLNTAKYGLASSFDRTLLDRHGRALTNLEVAAFSQDLDTLLLFQPGLLLEHEVLTEVPVNRKISLLALVGILGEHGGDWLLDLEHLQQNYTRRGLRRVQGVRDESGKLIEPWLKPELVEPGDWVKVQSFDVNRNTANLNVLIPRKVRLVPKDGGSPITEVAGVSLDNLNIFNNYTLVGDGELNVRTLRIRITARGLFDRLKGEGVLETESGEPPTVYSPDSAYILRLDLLPLVPAFEGPVNLDGVFEELAELKVLSSIVGAHLKEESDVYTPDQVEALKKHYLSRSLFLSFPTTTEYTDLQQALSAGSVDTRVSYKIDIGSRTILNLGKLHSANKFLDRIYELLDPNGQKIDKPTFEDLFERDVRVRHKVLSARTKVTKVDEFMKRLFDDFLAVPANGSAVKVLERVGARPLAEIVKQRARGKAPTHEAYVKALTDARARLESAQESIYREKVSPLVFFVGATGTLPDEVEARALSAEELSAKYPELALSRDEQDGTFFEIGQAILSVYAKNEYFTRTAVSGGANVAPGQV
jgi:Mg-chelatase subunit ChlD